MRWSESLFILAAAAGVLASAAPPVAAGQERTRPPGPGKTPSVPLVYSTDLYHPPGDADDQVDLATLFSLPELEVKAILLDTPARRGPKRSGRITVAQMLELTGRRGIACAEGLSRRLKSPQDTGEDQPPEGQKGVELLLSVLRRSEQPVQVIAVGSARDVTAAFNRHPDLLRSRIARLHVSIGSARVGESEYNARLDPAAFQGLLKSGLPVHWYPCKPLRDGRSTHWILPRFGHAFRTAPPPLQNYIVYALQRIDPRKLDPLAALAGDPRLQKQRVWSLRKDMWSTLCFLTASGRKIYRLGEGDWAAAHAPPAGGKEVALFEFAPARVEVDRTGTTRRVEYGAADANVKAARVLDPKRYSAVMTSCLRHLFEGFPLTGKHKAKKPQ